MGQSVDLIEIVKRQDYLQTSTATPINQPTLGSPDGGYHFVAAATGSALNLYSTGLKIRTPLSAQHTLIGDDTTVGFLQSFASKAEMDASFPAGSYPLIGTSPTPLATVPYVDSYPAEIPQVTNGTWDGSGQLLVAAANGASLTFNNFSLYNGTPGAFITFAIYGLDGTTVTSEIVSQINAKLDGNVDDPALTNFTIPANLLQAGRSYFAELSYVRFSSISANPAQIYQLAYGMRSTGFVIYCPANTSAPAITTQPTTRTVRVGQSTTFSVTATGNPAPTYQWYRNSVAISGATQSSLTLNNVTIPDGGEYKVRVSNIVESVFSVGALLFVDPAATLPVFTQQPTGLAIGINESITFTASATGEPVPTFQWKKNGNNISFATSSTYTLSLAQLTDSGTYTVVATNSAGSTTSSPAVLTVLAQVAPPAFTSSLPGALSLPAGASATISLPTSGSPAPTYAWSRGSTPLPGITGATITVQGNDDFTSDLYSVTVSNRYGTIGTSFSVNSYPANFDHAGYYARNQDLVAAYGTDASMAWWHFFTYGLAEGRSYDTQFRADEYLELNPDLKAVFGTDRQAALLHWLRYGHPLEDRMGRVPVGFNVDSYLSRYPDLGAAFGNITPLAVRNVTVWQHYLDWGVREGRSDGDFEAYNYLATNSDLAAVFGTDIEAAALHWYFYGRREGRRIPAVFNVQGYRTRNPDIVVVWGNDLYGSWLHYRDTGIYEGRTYDDLFRALEYRARYTDVQTAYGNDLTGILFHWLYYGSQEGRLGRNP